MKIPKQLFHKRVATLTSMGIIVVIIFVQSVGSAWREKEVLFFRREQKKNLIFILTPIPGFLRPLKPGGVNTW